VELDLYSPIRLNGVVLIKNAQRLPLPLPIG